MAWHYEERTPQQQPSRCRYLFLLHQMLLVSGFFTAFRMTVGREGRPVTLPPGGGYILIDAKGVDTTTLNGKAAVKPKNPWTVRPIKPKNLFPAPFGRPLFPCHRCHGQDDEGHAEELPETEGEAEDEKGKKNGGQRLDG